MTTLVLLRHSEAEPKESRPDFERRLTAAGNAQAARVGPALAAAGVRPSLLLSSPATRAIATAILVAPALTVPLDAIRTDPILYEGDAQAILHTIRHRPGLGDCLVVAGHNPGLRDLAIRLAGLEESWSLQKGQAVMLGFEGPWEMLSPGRAQVTGVVGP